MTGLITNPLFLLGALIVVVLVGLRLFLNRGAKLYIAKHKKEVDERYKHLPQTGKIYHFQYSLYNVEYVPSSYEVETGDVTGKVSIQLGYGYEVKSLDTRNLEDVLVGVSFTQNGQRKFRILHYNLRRNINRPEGLELWNCKIKDIEVVTEIPQDKR